MAVLVLTWGLAAAACGNDGSGSPFGPGRGPGQEQVDPGALDPADGSGLSGEELADQILGDALDLQLGDEQNQGSDPSRALDLDVEVVTGFEANTLAADGTTIWMADTDLGVIRSFDVRTGEVSDDIEVARDPVGIAVDGDEVWVANSNSFDHTVMRVNAGSGEIELTVETDAGTTPTGLALTEDHVWVGIGSRGEVAQIDRATGEILTVVDDDPSSLSGGGRVDVLATETAVWAIDTWCGRVIRIDPSTATVTSIHDDFGYVASEPETCTGSIAAPGPARLTDFEDGVFVLSGVLDADGRPAGRIYRIDEQTDEVRTVFELPFMPPAAIGRSGLPGLVVEDGGIWLSGGDRSVRIDRFQGRVDGAFAAESVVALIEVGGTVWHAVIDPFFEGADSGLYGVDTTDARVAAG